MSTVHLVQQGDHLAGIAGLHGFRDPMTVWDHPDNARLKGQRDNPNVLAPGDVVHVPDRQQRDETRPTGALHVFQAAGRPLLLRVVLRDFGNEPLARTDCLLQVDGRTVQLTTDADGLLETRIAASARTAVIVFSDPKVPFDLSVAVRIGHLDPVEQPSGQTARLANLGYITRPPEAVDDAFLALVVQEFQCDQGLEVSGVCDAATCDALRARHGC